MEEPTYLNRGMSAGLRTLNGRPGMTMAQSVKRGRYLLTLLVVVLALPIRGEESSTGAASSTSATAESQPSQEGTDQAKKAPQTPKAVAIQTPPESPTPPKNLRKVGDHWTPYEPPD